MSAGKLFKLFTLEAAWHFLSTYWPMAIPIAMTAANFIWQQIPLPYFFAALSLAIGGAAWAMRNFQEFLLYKDYQDFVVIQTPQLAQTPIENSENVRFHLFFSLANGYPKPLYIQLTEINWNIGGKHSAPMPNIHDVDGMFKGNVDFQAATIESLEIGKTYMGQFKLEAKIGRKLKKPEWLMTVVGQIDMLGSAKESKSLNLPIGVDIIRQEYKRI